ncbi:MAG TPA: response regulator [Thermodesulfovibrionales bacterium]|nr:response regulator [Thermodesulfovibrionales bacterium]
MTAIATHTVLVVDDNADDAEFTKRALLKSGRGGLRVRSVGRGESALTVLREEEELPSLILLDLKMPGMSGIDTLRQIRADERLRRIPVVILTNSTLESDEQEAYREGADGFLHKAFDIDQFEREIKAALYAWLGD